MWWEVPFVLPQIPLQQWPMLASLENFNIELKELNLQQGENKVNLKGVFVRGALTLGGGLADATQRDARRGATRRGGNRTLCRISQPRSWYGPPPRHLPQAQNSHRSQCKLPPQPETRHGPTQEICHSSDTATSCVGLCRTA